ncbi:protein-L-isoaspartate O-methyltransferase [Periconia macrospinosa]|uniref:protein-L-isoaspartate(D-aspartate) O-methyltransferase n=1 Tax=Periconia macrospinosa TaxID=97972 RepID=A0A2V1CZG2_9PLEO|nr:protein-L-isoaspartate O-methyltransferase [Periconia macrospinosa]
MFQQSSGDSNESLVENMCNSNLITHPLVESAFKVDRSQYAPREPYKDSPQLLSHQATISAPHMHAKAVNSLLPFLLPKDEIVGVKGRPRRVLDIGSGSGFLVHVFAELVGETGVVVGVDHIEELRNLGETNMRKSDEGIELLNSGRVHFRLGDGRKGWSGQSSTDADKEDGWDAIHVGAGAIRLHDELVRQLRSPGRLFIPVAEEESWFSDQYIWTVDKDEKGNVTKTKHYSAKYVWLMGAPEGPLGASVEDSSERL